MDEFLDYLFRMAECLPLPVCLKDNEGTYIYCNESYENMVMRPKSQLIGFTDFDLEPPEYANLLRNMEIAAVKSKNAVSFESSYTNHLGVDFFIRIHNEPCQAPSSDKPLILTTVFDMTQLKKLQNSIVESKIEAQESIQAKNQFLASMSHEIRTPLNGIIGMTELLADSNLDEPKREIVNLISEASDQLLEVVNEILDFSKIEAGKIQVEDSIVETRVFFGSIAETYRLQLTDRPIDLELTIEDDVPDFVRTDAAKLRQVLSNLLSNAVKFTAKGKIGLDVATESGDFARLSLTVHDTGIGIPEDMHESIFDVFTQVDNSFTRKSQGSGLGLAISRKLVSLLGGKLKLQSREGAGTTFLFSVNAFPAELSEHSGATTDTVRDYNLDVRKNRKKYTILVAEDNKISRVYMKRMLEINGFKVYLAENGTDAIKAARELIPNCILMDIQMPELDGVAATKALRGYPETRDIPIIALTAFALKGDEEFFLDQGVNEYLSKPVKEKDVLEVIDRMLSIVPPVKSTIYMSLLERYDDDRETLDQIIDIFLEETPARLQYWEDLQNNENANERESEGDSERAVDEMLNMAASIAHSCTNAYGALDMAERAGRSKTLERRILDRAYLEFRKLFPVCIEDLKKAFSEMQELKARGIV